MEQTHLNTVYGPVSLDSQSLNLKDDIHLDLKIHSYTYTVNIHSKAAYINRSYHSWVNAQE